MLGSHMYVFGGRADRFGPFHSNNEIYCNRIRVFDTRTEAWLDCPPTPVLPEGRRSHSACECVFCPAGVPLPAHCADTLDIPLSFQLAIMGSCTSLVATTRGLTGTSVTCGSLTLVKNTAFKGEARSS